jgi:acetoin utilization protein AcuC
MMKKLKVGIVYSDKLKDYDFGLGHPFRGDRFERFMAYFKNRHFDTEKFEIILNEELASNEDLFLWHKKEYIQALEKASAGVSIDNLMKFVSSDNINPKTRKFPEGLEKAARVVVKNSLISCDLVQKGKFEKVVSIGGGLHHAKPAFGEGFCVYNDVVISAKFLIKKYNLKRILILDTDAHAGNGTFEAFYEDPRVLFIDIHQKGIYPGEGYEYEIGSGAGKGFTVNIPLPAYASDASYKLVFEEIIFPLVEEFNPEFIIRNGGSDPHPSDSITELGLTLKGFNYIGKSIGSIAKSCNGKEIDLITSGYKPAVLAKAWSALILGLAGIKIELKEPYELNVKENQMLKQTKKIIYRLKQYLRPYWKTTF